MSAFAAFQRSADSIRSGRVKEVVTVPMVDLDGKPTEVQIEVRSMSAGDRGRFMSRMASGGAEDAVAAYGIDLVIACAWDVDDQVPIFKTPDGSEKPGARQLLSEQMAGTVEVIANAAIRVSGLDRVGFEEAKKASSETPRSSTASG